MTEKERRTAFVGPKSDYYLKRWENREGRFVSWNWAAFFGGDIWLAYRKMYWLAGARYALLTIVYLLKKWSAAWNLSEPLRNAWNELNFALSMAVVITFAVYANWFYLQKYTRVKEKLANGHKEEQLKQAGGTNKSVAIVLTVVVVIEFIVHTAVFWIGIASNQ